MNTKQLIRRIERTASGITSEILRDLIHDNASNRDKQIKDYKNYQGDDLPISSREFTDPLKLNNKINNDFRGEIVDQGIGYLFGSPITYTLDKGPYQEDDVSYQRDSDALQDFLTTNNMEDLDLEAGKKQGICGSVGRILYIDKEGQVRVMNVPSWEMIYVKDRSLDKMQYAMRYYYVDDVSKDANGKRIENKRTRVEWYDDEYIHFYISSGEDFVLDPSEPENPKRHMFNEVPVVEIQNNEERMSDFKKVEALIDAYDRTLSDAQNEIEEFRLAYMAAKGVSIDAEVVAAARQTGMFEIPDDASIEYLTKQINDGFLENHKETLRDNVYRFSKTVDISSDTFTGQGASGEARKWILTNLEWRCSIKEMKFKRAAQNMFRIAQSKWNKEDTTIDWKSISIQFDRNIPEELSMEAEILQKTAGHISHRKRLELFSPVRDVDAEMSQIEMERGDLVNLDEVDESVDE